MTNIPFYFNAKFYFISYKIFLNNKKGDPSDEREQIPG
ncbi:Uncharacterized protein dnm_096530 [Desulfonema magnum]|uniref:Uncharacterized protein n=1 Tax=Desulfonema magnum TaxID=45655 RepID=A0A975GTY7_9BACT|nr:Uncharacterized protein dnm_096530 [Desulfonema magnum]